MAIEIVVLFRHRFFISSSTLEARFFPLDQFRTGGRAIFAYFLSGLLLSFAVCHTKQCAKERRALIDLPANSNEGKASAGFGENSKS